MEYHDVVFCWVYNRFCMAEGRLIRKILKKCLDEKDSLCWIADLIDESFNLILLLSKSRVDITFFGNLPFVVL